MVCTIFTPYQKWSFSSVKSNLASVLLLLLDGADDAVAVADNVDDAKAVLAITVDPFRPNSVQTLAWNK